MEKIIAILKAHGVTTQINNGSLMARDEYTLNGILGFDLVCCDGWSVADVYKFLGY